MKHAAAWLMAIALSTPQISTAEEGQKMSQETHRVHALVKTMTQAFQNKDIASVMVAYEDVATVVFEPNTPISDPTQIKQAFSGMAGLSPQFTYPKGHEVIVNDDIALHISPWSMTATMPGGQEVSQSGLSVAVMRKQGDGSWKMVIDNPHGSRLLGQE